jgi:O-antigen/teichoic acid export membrane protein
MRRELVLGVTVCAALVWLMFFASAGSVMVATLVVAVAMLIWFSTVQADRLRDTSGNPHLMLFSLTALAGALVVTAAVFIATPIVFLIGCVVIAAAVVGVVRALRSAMDTG